MTSNNGSGRQSRAVVRPSLALAQAVDAALEAVKTAGVEAGVEDPARSPTHVRNDAGRKAEVSAQGRGFSMPKATGPPSPFFQVALEALESRLTQKILKARTEIEAALVGLEKRLAALELHRPDVDKRLSSLAGTCTGLSAELQAHIRLLALSNAQMGECRKQMEEDFRVRDLQQAKTDGQDSQEVAAALASLELALGQQSRRLAALEGSSKSSLGDSTLFELYSSFDSHPIKERSVAPARPAEYQKDSLTTIKELVLEQESGAVPPWFRQGTDYYPMLDEYTPAAMSATASRFFPSARSESSTLALQDEVASTSADPRKVSPSTSPESRSGSTASPRAGPASSPQGVRADMPLPEPVGPEVVRLQEVTKRYQQLDLRERAKSNPTGPT